MGKITWEDRINRSTPLGALYEASASIYNTLKESVNLLYDADDEQDTRLDNLEENQTTGVEVYSTFADLPVTGTALVSYKVSNDPDSSLNGYYHWETSAYVKDADLVSNDLDDTNTSDAVSGSAVGGYAKNGSVITDNLTRNFISTNKFNKLDLTLFSGTIYYSNYIKVVEGDVVTRNFGGTKFWYTYDINKVLVRNSLTGIGDELTVEANEFYVRSLIDTVGTTEDIFMITINEDIPLTYEGYLEDSVPFRPNTQYCYPELDENNQISEDQLPTIDEDKIPTLELTKTEGYYLLENVFDSRYSEEYPPQPGVLSWSNYIEVVENDIVRRNFDESKYWGIYDENQQVISETVTGSLEYTVTSGTYYVRSLYSDSLEDTFMLTLNTAMPEDYVPFAYKNDLLYFVNKDDVANLSSWKGEKAAFLGDSLIRGAIPANSSGYPGTLNSFAKLVSEDLGMEIQNEGVDGSTLAKKDGSVMYAMVERYTDLDDDASLVVVMGGTNDARTSVPIGVMADRTEDTYYGALHILCEGLLEKYQNDQIGVDADQKQIVFCTPPKLGTTYGTTYGGSTIQDYGSAVKEVCNYYSIPVFDMESESEINPHILKTLQGTEPGWTDMYNPFITDAVHPTQEGHQIIANRFKGYLKQLR